MNRSPGHEDIMRGLRDDHYPRWRERHREESIAATFKHDDRMENMLRQLQEDQRLFDQTYGPHGRTMVGMYEQAKRAALGPDAEDQTGPETAA